MGYLGISESRRTCLGGPFNKDYHILGLYWGLLI